ncbi:MAG: MBL fold metallo-hydrolase [Clostridia bacterium]|nr:MBL fold metallo-hydrolase [Clostridia bacterium]
MEIKDLSPGGFACACYLVCEGKDAVLIDCSAPVASVTAALAEHGARLRALLCTHGHFDHLLTADALRNTFGVPLFVHESDAEMLSDGQKNAYATFFGHDRTWFPAQQTFKDGAVLTFGSLRFEVMHTPGHSKGSSVFLCGDVAFTGDTLFADSYGRTDLYGGDPTALRHSLQRLSALAPDLHIYPGHGSHTTLHEAMERLF